MERGAWKSNTGFILAAVGSAVGLGNIWRFSYLCHKNGGGSFLVPYFIALLAAGIPILILEFAIGHKMRASAPKAMYTVHKEWEWLGWWPVLFVMFGIDLYYSVVIAWCALYVVFSAQGFWGAFPWEPDAAAFFTQQFLGKGDGGDVFHPGAVRWPILAMTAGIWAILWVICIRRIDKGVEVACKIFMPVLVLLTVLLVIWGLTLDGAMEGVRQYLYPDFSKLAEAQVWRDAFGQIFFSLSIGFGIMIAYASYLPPKTDLVRSAMITAFADCGYSIFAGFAVFSVLGYMAFTQNVPFHDVVTAGPGLCFVVYPEAISNLPGPRTLFGLAFFTTLTLAGITSAVSIFEAFTSAVVDKFGWNRARVVTTSAVLGFLGSVIFTTRSGDMWLDIVDHFLNAYGLILVGLLECLLIVWYYRIDRLHFHLSDASEGGYPKAWDIWWEWSVKFAAPTALVFVLAWSAIDDLRTPYEGYPVQALLIVGLGWLVCTFLAAGVFSVSAKHMPNGSLDL